MLTSVLRVGTLSAALFTQPSWFDSTSVGSSEIVDCATLARIPSQEFYEFPVCVRVIEPSYDLPDPDTYLTHNGTLTITYTPCVEFNPVLYRVDERSVTPLLVEWTDTIGTLPLESDLPVDNRSVIYTAEEFTLQGSGRYSEPHIFSVWVGPYQTDLQVDVSNLVDGVGVTYPTEVIVPRNTLTPLVFYQLDDPDEDDFPIGIQFVSSGTIRIFFEGNVTQTGCPSNFRLIGCSSFFISGVASSLNAVEFTVIARSTDIRTQIYIYKPSTPFYEDVDPLKWYTVRIKLEGEEESSGSADALIFLTLVLPGAVAAFCLLACCAPCFLGYTICTDFWKTVGRCMCRRITWVQCVDHLCGTEKDDDIPVAKYDPEKEPFIGKKTSGLPTFK